MNSTRRIELPYGSAPLVARVPGDAVVVDLPVVHAPQTSLASILDRALAHPIGAAPLTGAAAATVVVSDATRSEPRAAMLDAVLRRIGDATLTIAIANGTHAPGDPRELGLAGDVLARARIVNHDGADDGALVQVGTTRRGTPLVVHRCLVESSLVVATGRIKPHYFAGYGAGAKALFPGLGQTRAVRVNHALKQESGARGGDVDGNPCREDLEEIVDALDAELHLLNVVTDGEGRVQSAVAGDVRAAFRAGAAACAPLFTVDAPMADCIVVSDALPLTGSLYQASKLVAACAARLRPGGRIVIAAECPGGVGPVDVVNRGIYEIGLAPRLPADHRIALVSSLSQVDVEETYCEWAPSVEAAIADVVGTVLVFPRAGDILLPS